MGKSTLLSLLTGENAGGVVSGTIERGESLNIGYYHQGGMEFDENDTVLETVPDTRLLNLFLFPHEMLGNRISRLSGGERRRLYLLTILMKNPNVLILDEPTNDLDIVTLNVLEEYLLDFKGTLMIVTHDRHFLDRLVDHLFVFCGDGRIKDFIGGYTEYRSFIKDYEAEQRKLAAPKKAAVPSKPAADKPRKLSYKEKREMEQLEADLDAIAAEKASLEALLNGGTTDYERIREASEKYELLRIRQDEKELRWLELSEIAD